VRFARGFWEIEMSRRPIQPRDGAHGAPFDLIQFQSAREQSASTGRMTFAPPRGDRPEESGNRAQLSS